MNPTSCLFGSRFAKNPVFLLAGTLLFDEKIRQSAALFWFGLRDVGILYSQAVIQRTFDVSLPYFCNTVRQKRLQFEHMQTVIQTSRRLYSFLHEAVQNFELLSNIQDQKYKIKNTYWLMSFSRPIQSYHSHADPIWPDGTGATFRSP